MSIDDPRDAGDLEERRILADVVGTRIKIKINGFEINQNALRFKRILFLSFLTSIVSYSFCSSTLQASNVLRLLLG